MSSPVCTIIYLVNELCQVADVEVLQRLRSTLSLSLIVGHTWLSTVGDRAFAFAAACISVSQSIGPAAGDVAYVSMKETNGKHRRHLKQFAKACHFCTVDGCLQVVPQVSTFSPFLCPAPDCAAYSVRPLTVYHFGQFNHSCYVSLRYITHFCCWVAWRASKSPSISILTSLLGLRKNGSVKQKLKAMLSLVSFTSIQNDCLVRATLEFNTQWIQHQIDCCFQLTNHIAVACSDSELEDLFV